MALAALPIPPATGTIVSFHGSTLARCQKYVNVMMIPTDPSHGPCERCVAGGSADLCVDPELRLKGRRPRSAKEERQRFQGAWWITSLLSLPPLLVVDLHSLILARKQHL